MRITEELLSEIEPSLRSILMTHGLLVDKIQVDEIEDDDDILALCLTKLTFTLEATVIFYKREK